MSLEYFKTDGLKLLHFAWLKLCIKSWNFLWKM